MKPPKPFLYVYAKAQCLLLLHFGLYLQKRSAHKGLRCLCLHSLLLLHFGLYLQKCSALKSVRCFCLHSLLPYAFSLV